MKKPAPKRAVRATRPDPDGILPEYDFRNARRNPYAAGLAGSRIVVVDPDLAKLFPTSAAVNRALRTVANSRRVKRTAARKKRPAPQRKES